MHGFRSSIVGTRPPLFYFILQGALLFITVFADIAGNLNQVFYAGILNCRHPLKMLQIHFIIRDFVLISYLKKFNEERVFLE